MWEYVQQREIQYNDPEEKKRALELLSSRGASPRNEFLQFTAHISPQFVVSHSWAQTILDWRLRYTKLIIINLKSKVNFVVCSGYKSNIAKN